MIDLLIIGGLSYGFMKLCKKGGKAVADANYSKYCPCCGTRVAPDGDSASTLYWKGTGGSPAYWYTCPRCGRKFSNAPW